MELFFYTIDLSRYVYSVKIIKMIQNVFVDLLLLYSKRTGLLFKIKKSLLRLKKGLAQESVETKEMLSIYQRYTTGQASAEEMKKANKQFADVLKAMGLGVLLVLPFAPVTLPLIVKMGQKLGIDIIPSSFKDNDDQDN